MPWKVSAEVHKNGRAMEIVSMESQLTSIGQVNSSSIGAWQVATKHTKDHKKVFQKQSKQFSGNGKYFSVAK